MTNRSREEPQHQFLSIAPYHLSRSRAERLVFDKLTLLNPGIKRRSWRKDPIFITYPDGSRSEHGFPELVKEARLTGTLALLKRFTDFKDHYFGGVFDSAVNKEGVHMGTEYAGYKDNVQGPGRVAPVEDELTNDILAFRRLAVAESANFPYEETARYHRAYVFASTGLVEAFMNRHVLIAEHKRTHLSVVQDIKKTTNLEERLGKWLSLFANSNVQELKQHNAEWSQFQELRKERNRFIHGLTPFIGLGLKAAATKLNLVRKGVGGLLLRIRELQGLRALGFIEQLTSAPTVKFMSQRRKRK